MNLPFPQSTFVRSAVSHTSVSVPFSPFLRMFIDTRTFPPTYCKIFLYFTFVFTNYQYERSLNFRWQPIIQFGVFYTLFIPRILPTMWSERRRKNFAHSAHIKLPEVSLWSVPVIQQMQLMKHAWLKWNADYVPCLWGSLIAGSGGGCQLGAYYLRHFLMTCHWIWMEKCVARCEPRNMVWPPFSSSFPISDSIVAKIERCFTRGFLVFTLFMLGIWDRVRVPEGPVDGTTAVF